MVTKTIGERNRTAPHIKLVANRESAASDSLNFFSAEFGNNSPPLAYGGGADPERPRDVRGVLKVINNVLLEHDSRFTTVKNELQPHLNRRGLTSVAMEKRLTTLADRLRDAMGSKITPSELARACSVSPAAVTKWLDGQTKELKASNYADAARALGVREEWLRTGKLPREREGAADEQDIDHVLDLLNDLRTPLAALAVALDRISQSRPEKGRTRKKA